MSLEIQTTVQEPSEISQNTVTVPRFAIDLQRDWRQCWYPVTFVQDLPKGHPYPFSIHDEPFVLFRNGEGQLGCLWDRCSHRAAKLSDGQVMDGKLECLYHGWQFSIQGQCLHIPQLPPDAKMPLAACVKSFPVVERQGMVWVWPGEEDAADDTLIPTIPELDNPKYAHTDVVYDLPYDQTFFIENVLDPAHVNISHHGSQGNRNQAQPLDMEVLESSAAGIQGRWKGSSRPGVGKSWVSLGFIAPNFVIYKFSIESKGWLGGLALYSLPMGEGRCRILTRNYRDFMKWEFQLKPRWFDHWLRCRVLEEDLSLVLGQAEQIAALEASLNQLYLPLKSCDTFVVEYRKWLDKFGEFFPSYQGYATAKLKGKRQVTSQPMNRLHQHTQICQSCSQAYQRTLKIKQISIAAAIGFASIAILAQDGSGLQIGGILTALFAVILAGAAHQVKIHFEQPYRRKSEHRLKL